MEGNWVFDQSPETIKPTRTLLPPTSHYMARYCLSCFELGFLFFAAENILLDILPLLGKNKLRHNKGNDLPWVLQLVNSIEGSPPVRELRFKAVFTMPHAPLLLLVTLWGLPP